MNDYVPPDAALADAVHLRQEEFRAIQARLETLPDEELRKILYSKEDPTKRLAASGILFVRLGKCRERNYETLRTRVVELFGGLLNDAHPAIAKHAIRHCPLIEEQHIEAVRAALDHSNPEIQAEAALALANINETQVFPKLSQWFHGEEDGLRNVAIEAMKTLNTKEAKETLIESYELGGRNEIDKVLLACALLCAGDCRGVPFLESIALRADGASSVLAATWLYTYNLSDEGLKLMLHILDHGNDNAKQRMVGQIRGWTLDEARLWVETKLKSSDRMSS